MHSCTPESMTAVFIFPDRELAFQIWLGRGVGGGFNLTLKVKESDISADEFFCKGREY